SRRTYLKKVALAEWDGVTANTTFVLEAVEGKLLQELLPWLMLSDRFTKHSIQESKGSTNPYINFPDIAKFEFDVPPLDQQHRIAEIIWEVDETLQRWRHTSEALQTARAATIEKHFAESTDTETKQLAEVGEVVYGITLGSYRSNLPVEKPYLRVANVGREQFDLTEVKTIRCTEDEAVKFALSQGDVLIVEGHASVDEIGCVAVWSSEQNGTLHQNHLIRVRCSSKLSLDYLSFYANSSRGRVYFRSRVKSSSGLNIINSTVVKEFPVPVLDTEKQSAFIERIRQLDYSLTAVVDSQLGFEKALKGFFNILFA